jgi:hypothetical protein
MVPIVECPGAPRKPPRNNPAGELERVADDIQPFGIYPEHMDRLALIGKDIVRIYSPAPDFIVALHEFEDYFERWGVCSDTFCSFHGKCMEVCGLTTQDAVIIDEADDGEPEVSSAVPMSDIERIATIDPLLAHCAVIVNDPVQTSAMAKFAEGKMS